MDAPGRERRQAVAQAEEHPVGEAPDHELAHAQARQLDGLIAVAILEASVVLGAEQQVEPTPSARS